MTMLFFVFLEVHLRRDTVQAFHFRVLAGNLILPILIFFLIKPFSIPIASASFIIAAMPTAGVAPIIAGFLKSRVEWVTASVLITSPVLALALPFLFSVTGGAQVDISFWAVMIPIGTVIFIPLILGQSVKFLWPKGRKFILKFKRISFYLFLTNVFIASANASHFIQNNPQIGWDQIIYLALAIGAVCLFCFLFGEQLGRKNARIEASLGLGRKNTMFGIWIALTFFSPFVALGPMIYILFQNAYNSYQIFQLDRSAKV